MDAIANRVRGVEKRFSGFATRTMKQIIVLAAKPEGGFLRIEACPGCCDPTGRVRWMNSKLLSAAKIDRCLQSYTNFTPVTNRSAATAGRKVPSGMRLAI
jgi:hypothetical protein